MNRIAGRVIFLWQFNNPIPGKIAVYAGKGTKLVPETIESLRAQVDERINPVISIDEAADFHKGTILKESTLLVIPGGEDRYYCEELNGAGTDNIAEFARRNAVLGLCAGGYFGARRIEYHKGLADEVIEDRGLALFPGTAVSIDTAFGLPYDHEVQSISTPEIKLFNGEKFRVYLHGGSIFRPDAGHEFGVIRNRLMELGRFADLPGRPVCIARVNHPEGGRTILSGVHFELPGAWVAGNLKAIPAGKNYPHIGAALEQDERQRRTLFMSVLRQCRIALSSTPKLDHVTKPLTSFLARPVFDDAGIVPVV